jgi:hypothetical protein
MCDAESAGGVELSFQATEGALFQSNSYFFDSAIVSFIARPCCEYASDDVECKC